MSNWKYSQVSVVMWQQEAPKADAHVSSADTNPLGAFRPSLRVAPGQSVLEQSTMLVGGVLVEHLGPALAQTVGTFLGSVLADSRFHVVRESPFTDKYLPPPFRRLHAVRSVVDFHDPEIAHDLGPGGFAYASAPTDAEGNKRPKDTSFKASGFDMELWRLKDHGYPRTRIPDGLLYDLVDSVLAVQAEYQLQCVFVDRELANIIGSRGREEQWLYQKTADWAVERARAEMEAKEKSSAFWGFVGDILGLVSAAAGVLALIPIFTPLMAPIAIVTAVTSMGAHAAAVSIAGNWDDPAAIAGLAADTLAAIPAVGAVAKGARAAWAAARMNKVANVIVNQGGRAFAGAIAGKGASDASHIFDYIGQKGAQVVKGTVSQGQIAGKVLQGSVSLTTQVPLVIELSTKTAVDQQAKDAATGTALTANVGHRGRMGRGRCPREETQHQRRTLQSFLQPPVDHSPEPGTTCKSGLHRPPGPSDPAAVWRDTL
ncbi:hypothetical protein [Streptomyces ochraceiscleroticus]|uniref:hypothetical protein n=1 Tax=Streptomyces ochraceiscleroticus TaxID=47761 RepID=UPI0004C59172|nr:hypothetical protein [Streptomyces ochraceiscleroticus]